MASPEFKTPGPPAFWASSRIQGAGEQAQIGGILLRAVEPDVTIFVDNFVFARTSRPGDIRIPLPQAAYEIRLEKPGFQALKLPVNVLKDQETQLDVKLQREVIVATSFMITGAPSGAMVRLDGKNLGPVQVDGTFTYNSNPGMHTIEMERTGYLPFRYQEAFSLGKTIQIDGKMAQDPEQVEYAKIASSSDPALLRQFLRQYPNSKNAPQVFDRLQEMEWNSLDKTNLTSLDAFLRSYPQSPHANEGRGLVAQLQKEQSEAIAAINTGKTPALRAYLDRYPQSQYARRVRDMLTQQLDKEAVLDVLHRYEESYNRQDLEGIVNLWPSCPDRTKKVLQASFHSTQKQILQLTVEGDPDIKGNFASVRGQETRSGSLTSTASVTITLVRQSGSWFIQSGNF